MNRCARQHGAPSDTEGAPNAPVCVPLADGLATHDRHACGPVSPVDVFWQRAFIVAVGKLRTPPRRSWCPRRWEHCRPRPSGPASMLFCPATA